jgi:hypothetical protein
VAPEEDPPVGLVRKEMLKLLNISSFYAAKGENAVQNLQSQHIPQLKIHDAE